MLAFPRRSALLLSQTLAELDEEPDDFDIDLSGILTEVGNIVLNGVVGSIGNILDIGLSYTVPELSINQDVAHKIREHGQEDEEQVVILANTTFEVEDREVSGSLLVVFRIGLIRDALNEYYENTILSLT